MLRAQNGKTTVGNPAIPRVMENWPDGPIKTEHAERNPGQLGAVSGKIRPLE